MSPSPNNTSGLGTSSGGPKTAFESKNGGKSSGTTLGAASQYASITSISRSAVSMSTTDIHAYLVYVEEIVRHFIELKADHQVNIPSGVLTSVLGRYEDVKEDFKKLSENQGDSDTLDTMDGDFAMMLELKLSLVLLEPLKEVHEMVYRDTYSRFLLSKEYKAWLPDYLESVGDTESNTRTVNNSANHHSVY